MCERIEGRRRRDACSPAMDLVLCTELSQGWNRMSESNNTIRWVTPGGMFIPENESIHEGEPVLLAMKGGRSQLAQLLSFDPDMSTMWVRSKQNPDPIELSHSYIQWLRLLEPVHLLRAGSHKAYTDEEWQRLLKLVEIRFKSGDVLNGEAPALMQNDKGWYFFLVKQTNEVFRYFIPHRGVEEVKLNGEVQARLDKLAPVVREMKHARLADILRERPEKYPYALETLYPRVLNRIMDLWDSPPALQECFEELMVDKRGGRQGFPRDVAHDIFVLSGVYDDYLSRPPEGIDPWASEQARADLEQQGFEFTAGRFHKAVERNNFEVVQLYLKAGMSVDTPGEAGWTPLMVASFNGNEMVAEYLLEHGANPFFTDTAGYMPLHWAAFNGFVRVTAILLGKRVPANAADPYGWTPLLQASAQGHLKVCEMLIKSGANAGCADVEGWTPLHKAVANRHVDIVRLLLQHGGDVRAAHKSGMTPIKIAHQKGFTEIYQLLLDAFNSGGSVNQDGSINFR